MMGDGRLPIKQLGIMGFMDALDWLISNPVLATAGTEYPFALQDNVKQITISARGRAKVLIAFVAGETATNYMTLDKGQTRIFTSLDLTGKYLYFNSNLNSTVMEIVELL